MPHVHESVTSDYYNGDSFNPWMDEENYVLPVQHEVTIWSIDAL